MTKAIGYVRVSTTRQANEGVSLAAQRERIDAWAKYAGVELVEVFADNGVSGTKRNRRGLEAALKAATAKKGQTLIVFSLSRLARSTTHLLAIAERLQKSGTNLVSLSEQIDTTTAAGKLAFTVFAGMAQFVRDTIAEQTAEALAHKKAKGEKVGGRVPFGFDVDRSGGVAVLVPNDAEQAIIAEIKTMRERGVSFRAIVAELQTRGVPTKTGGQWSVRMVWNLMQRADGAPRQSPQIARPTHAASRKPVRSAQ